MSLQKSRITLVLTITEQEAADGVYSMADLSYLELESLVDYFYKLEFNSIVKEDSEMSSPQLCARMFGLGDRFDIFELRETAVRKYKTAFINAMDNKVPSQAIKSVRDVYEASHSSVSDLRTATCALVREHLATFMDIKDCEMQFKAIQDDVPDFTKDLLALYVEESTHMSLSQHGE